VQFANAKSTSEGLEECYALTGCTANAWKSGYSNCSTVIFYHGADCTGYRLPSEPEWEYAYRAGTTTAFYNGPITAPDGNDPNLNLIGWYSQNSGGKTHPFGQKDPNAWGLFDIAGNVYELTNESLQYLDYTVQRGGAFGYQARYARAASRLYYYYSRTSRDGGTGFRLVRTVPSQIYTPPTF
jgi:formylglycine-generating enzyme required for sulfatase activity